MKPSDKWKIPTSQVCKEEKQSKPDIAGNAQVRTINGIFMFGSAVTKVTETKGSLPALQELPSQQEIVGNQVKFTKKPRTLGVCASIFGSGNKTTNNGQNCRQRQHHYGPFFFRLSASTRQLHGNLLWWVCPFGDPGCTVRGRFCVSSAYLKQPQQKIADSNATSLVVVLARDKAFHFVTYVLPPPLKVSPLALPR